MSDALIILGLILSPGLWTAGTKLLDSWFARKKEANKELKEDGLVFREFLMSENKDLKSKLDTLIASNEALIKSNNDLNVELKKALSELEDKNDIIAKMEQEVENLKTQIAILNDLLKK